LPIKTISLLLEIGAGRCFLMAVLDCEDDLVNSRWQFVVEYMPFVDEKMPSVPQKELSVIRRKPLWKN
jgi:hypothetical protein